MEEVVDCTLTVKLVVFSPFFPFRKHRQSVEIVLRWGGRKDPFLFRQIPSFPPRFCFMPWWHVSHFRNNEKEAIDPQPFPTFSRSETAEIAL